MDKIDKMVSIFKVLSVDTRVKIIELLKERALCVNALACRLDITPAATSQHLRIMRNMEIVSAEKRGYYIHYSLNQDTLAEWYELAKDLLGNGD